MQRLKDQIYIWVVFFRHLTIQWNFDSGNDDAITKQYSMHKFLNSAF